MNTKEQYASKFELTLGTIGLILLIVLIATI